MRCPGCGRDLCRWAWSKKQWTSYRPVVEEYYLNCCKECDKDHFRADLVVDESWGAEQPPPSPGPRPGWVPPSWWVPPSTVPPPAGVPQPSGPPPRSRSPTSGSSPWTSQPSEPSVATFRESYDPEKDFSQCPSLKLRDLEKGSNDPTRVERIMKELPYQKQTEHAVAYKELSAAFRRIVSPLFFDIWKQLLHKLEELHRETMTRFKEQTGMQASMLKHFSYFGACRICFQLPPSDWKFVYLAKETDELFIDIGNWWYAYLLDELAGDKVLPHTNDETKGDVIESLLGWWWLVQNNKLAKSFAFDDKSLNVLTLLNDLLLHGFYSYVLYSEPLD